MDRALAKLRSAGLKESEFARIERNASIMRERIVLRAARVAEQLAGIEPAALQFDADGLARLSGWRDESDRGEPVMDQHASDGRRTLHIKAEGGHSRASWRTQVYLARGRYRFEGLVRAADITGVGAGLRISGDQRNRRIGGTAGWRPLMHEFEVKEAGADVEFVCDINALQGEVWFDSDSLKVKRL